MGGSILDRVRSAYSSIGTCTFNTRASVQRYVAFSVDPTMKNLYVVSTLSATATAKSHTGSITAPNSHLSLLSIKLRPLRTTAALGSEVADSVCHHLVNRSSLADEFNPDPFSREPTFLCESWPHCTLSTPSGLPSHSVLRVRRGNGTASGEDDV